MTATISSFDCDARTPDATSAVSPGASLPEEEKFASWPLVRPPGRISSRGAAGVDLLDTLGYERAARAASRIEGSIESFYRLVAENRDRLGRLVPDGPAPRRF